MTSAIRKTTSPDAPGENKNGFFCGQVDPNTTRSHRQTPTDTANRHRAFIPTRRKKRSAAGGSVHRPFSSGSGSKAAAAAGRAGRLATKEGLCGDRGVLWRSWRSVLLARRAPCARAARCPVCRRSHRHTTKREKVKQKAGPFGFRGGRIVRRPWLVEPKLGKSSTSKNCNKLAVQLAKTSAPN